MRIGIDFDNTIVSYDALFHQVALERQLISPSLPKSKLVVRDYLRENNKEDLWTLMQGEVYGSRMDEAIAYPGFFKFVKKAQECGHQIFIISHKTRHPFAGPKYDLHQAAKNWINKHMPLNGIQFNQKEDSFFEITKYKKILRIEKLRCDYFIDDLPEILRHENFPVSTKKLLFNPENIMSDNHVGIQNTSSWHEIEMNILK